jgi:hypothetical protein
MNVEYQSAGLKAYVKLGKVPKEGRFSTNKDNKAAFLGKIYEYNPEKSKKIEQPKYQKVSNAFDGKKDLIRDVCEVTGSYWEGIEFDGICYWDITKDIALQQAYGEHPLPSDFRWREDLCWLHYKDLKLAEEWKLELERVQRNDRGVRDKWAKENKVKLPPHKPW